MNLVDEVVIGRMMMRAEECAIAECIADCVCSETAILAVLEYLLEDLALNILTMNAP
jgi:hypothetical protein